MACVRTVNMPLGALVSFIDISFGINGESQLIMSQAHIREKRDAEAATL